jgi:CheY-like chemotaxis protein
MSFSKPSATNRASVLIVEDEIIVGMEIREKLQSLGWRVSGLVTSGSEALAAAEADRPDVVLMDITIKGEIDGIETARRLQARHRIPIIFITAFVRPGLRRPRRKTDAFVWLSKPLVDEELIRAIRTALTRKRKPAARPRRSSPSGR